MLRAYSGLLVLILTNIVFPTNSIAETEFGQWRFSVLLNGNSIGEHRYTLSAQGDLLEVHSQAEMKVKFLFFEAFRYEHTATEVWQDNCLLSIESQTDNNNEMLKVSGRREQQSFQVAATENDATLQGCIRSFAYWNQSAILGAKELLNSQTGELMPIVVETGQWENINAAGREWQAQRFSLIGRNLHIDLWYGPEGEWLQLRSTLDNGRELDYQLQEGPFPMQPQRAVENTTPSNRNI